jgi:hypothetical protein
MPRDPASSGDQVALALAQQFTNVWRDHILALQTTTLLFQGTRVTYYDSALTWHEGIADQPAGGGATGIAVDASCCMVISWASTAHWRGGHPRTYMPGINQADLATPIKFAAPWVDTCQNAWNQWYNAIIGQLSPDYSSLRLGFLHRWEQKQLLATPVFYDIHTPTVKHSIGNQRRRLGPFS